ncbi:hypothetical protein MIT9_P2129 [Methylomarinovum caldicuralii]|uniref:YhdP central domain-containing protein n=1 Tax=Methylomarinovum caldicuralii TaxID=438856 RepID=A0AAU9C477_9GAMM|nr:AsmA-like C-terminal region-containing protein [Methylomarinovum caldicuralii]BCX82543.1 hypothetical protein MIT9_P2129 [Methylomarinovum caldicuralii]
MRLFHHTLRLTRGLLLTALALLALGLSLLRFWLLPQIDILRHRLEVEISRRLNQPVSIAGLRADIHHLTPKLRLLDVRVGYRHPLRIAELQLVPDFAASLAQRQLRLQRFRLVGARVEIQRRPGGGWKIVGLPAGEAGGPAWLLSDGRFELIRTTLIWHHHADRPPLVLRDVSLCLQNRDGHHRLQGVYPTASGILRATIDFQRPTDTMLWQGRFIAEGKNLQLDDPASALLPWPLRIRGDLALWGHWQGGEGQLQARLALHGIHGQISALQQPLAIARADGELGFNWGKDRWRLHSERLALANADALLQTRFTLRGGQNSPPSLDLRGHLGYLNLARLHAYLPQAASRTAAWLRRNLEGRLQGDLLWHGPLDGWPFPDHRGHMEARLTGSEVRIRFNRHWPAITDAAVDIRLNDARLEGRLLAGRIAAIPIRRLTAQLDLSDPALPLQLHGETRATLAQARRLLRLSPLQAAIRHIDHWLQARGRGRVTLDVQVPLQDSKTFQLQGHARIRGAELALSPYPLTLHPYQARFDFDQARFRADIEGRWRNQPATLKISSGSQDTRVLFHTRVDTAAAPELNAVDGVHGAAALDGELRIPHREDKAAVLQLASDLQGLAIDRPPPLGKPARQRRPFTLRAWLREDADIPLDVEYPPLDAALVWHPKQRRLSGRIGVNQPPPPPGVNPAGIVVQGRLAHLPLDPWLDEAHATALPARFMPQALDLKVRHLQWHGQDLGRHRLQLTRNETGWSTQLESDYVQGRGRFDDGRLDIDLEFLDLARVHRLLNAAPVSAGTDVLSALTGLRLRCRRLLWERIDLGHLQLSLTPDPSPFGLQLKLRAATHRLEARGRWIPAFPGHTDLEGRFSSPDLGRFLRRIEHPTLLADTPARLDFRLHWPGAPYAIDPARLDGELYLRTGPGRLPAIEPGAGRLLGLLYLGTLQRRLRLDFSDLFAEGLAYERIEGHIHLRQGNAVTDDFLVDAVPARITLSGSADLRHQTVDEIVTVRPNTPLTLGVFPQSSGLAARLQRLFNAPLDSLTQSQYAITGPWDDPTIVRIRRNLPESLWKQPLK